jgi:Tfp pilus assembly protein PilE
MLDMGRSATSNKGFSIVEAIIVIAAIGILGASGWFVYQHNRAKVTDAAGGTQATNQGTQQTTTTAPTANQSVAKIPELGIQITVSNEIKDLTYKVGTTTLGDGRQETYALFSTTSLTATDAKCGTDFGPLGALSKISGQYPTTFSDSNPPMEYGGLVKQFPAFFISTSGPQASCSENSTVLANASKFRGDFQAALSTIQPLN